VIVDGTKYKNKVTSFVSDVEDNEFIFDKSKNKIIHNKTKKELTLNEFVDVLVKNHLSDRLLRLKLLTLMTITVLKETNDLTQKQR
jgi:hypothetical protein